MLQKNIVKKVLAVAVIFLFIIVSFQPVFAINSKSKNETIDNKSNNENKLEYIIEITKEKKIISYSVFLTEKQANDLDTLIESIHSKLNNSKTNEDTAKIFYDSVDSFNGLGIFPDNNISINEVKQLVTGENREIDKIRFKSEIGDGVENIFCYVACNTTNTFTIGPILLLAGLTFIPYLAIVSFLRFLDHINISKFKIFYTMIMIPYWLLRIAFFSSLLSIFNTLPYSIGSLIIFGYYGGNLYYPESFPSNGWIYTSGLNGVKSYTGDFYGKLFKIWFFYWDFYNGITGFTGMSIRYPDNVTVFRLGYGLHVKI